MKQILFRSLLITSIFFVSCGDDDGPAPRGDYDNGVLVINEGNFTEGDGSVTFYSRVSGEVEQAIFQGVNDEPALGDVIQSGYSHNGLTYLVANNSNKVEVVNSFTFESQFTMTNVTLPRYMTVANDKGYVTEWVGFGSPGQVLVFNLETGEEEEVISVGSLPEDIEVAGNNIYVTEAFGNALYIIDTANDNQITTLTLGNGTKQIVVDSNDDLWIACGGGFDPSTFAPLGDGSLYKINTATNEIAVTVELNTNYDGKLAASADENTIYFYIGNAVFSLNTLGSSIASTPLFTVSDAVSLYGIGVDPATGVLYVGDSKAFSDDGEVFRYNPDGSFIDSFTSGRGPNGFLFN